MTETDLQAPKRARTGLSAMLLPELKSLAGELGIKGTSGMRKGDLIDVIRAHQQGGRPAAAKNAAPKADAPKAEKAKTDAPKATRTAEAPKQDAPKAEAPKNEAPKNEAPKNESTKNDAPAAQKPAVEKSAGEKPAGEKSDDQPSGDNTAADRPARNRDRDRNRNRNRDRNQGDQAQSAEKPAGDKQSGDNTQGEKSENQGEKNRGGQNQGNRQNNNNDDDDGDGNGRRRGRRFRERRRGRDRGGDGNNAEPQVNEGDTVVPVAGILDVLDNYAFVRTSGYLAGSNDVYVSMNLVRRNGLRRGDAITGAVKVAKDGEGQQGGGNNRAKFNPLVRLDTVNGAPVEAARNRPEFSKLTPLYPNQRLRLETTPERLSTRVIDLIMPIGKGQRALIVSPPKAGKTTILQDIANAISINNPECHLMVVLVDERPEEVTDMTRSVNGEVIASTFDRPPSDHTSVAELAIERAKRLVEGGMDVVVLLDSITRLGRAYNNASPASGRILSGGVDSTALYPPKRFLGAARNIENGGSLTIIASALVETGSTGDTVIFEEFKGTGNAELKLDRKISERRVFPAVDVNLSSTRKDELLLSPDEFAIVHKLRRLLSGLDSQAAIDLLVSQLKKTRSNVEFLMQVSKNAPVASDD